MAVLKVFLHEDLLTSQEMIDVEKRKLKETWEFFLILKAILWKQKQIYSALIERRTRINGWKFQESSFLINIRLTFLIIRMFHNQLLISFSRLHLLLLAEFIVFLNLHSSKASLLQHSAFLIVPLSHPYMTTGKTIALTRQTFVGKVMSLLFNMLSRLVITFLPRRSVL